MTTASEEHLWNTPCTIPPSMHRAISQGLDWAVSNIWLTSPFGSNYQPIPLVENQFPHEALDEEALAILRQPSLYTKRVQLLQKGISSQAA